MNDCTATGTITLDGHQVAVICNLRPHQGDQHHDVVHGDWEDAVSEAGQRLLLGGMGQPDAPTAVLAAWRAGDLTPRDLRDLLPFLWSKIDAPEQALGTSTWVAMFRAAGFAKLPTNLPDLQYPLAVYRGAPIERARGMAWSTSRTAAEQHQQRCIQRREDGHLFTAVLASGTALAHINTRSENEVIVDPDSLRDVVQLD